jgi:hypothetical protein
VIGMNCKQYRAEIEASDFAAGRPPARSESHAAACAECRDFGGERAALRVLVAGLARVDAPPDFELRLRARMAAAEAEQARPRSHNLLPRAAWLASAGCLALALALALQTRNPQAPEARDAPANPVATAGAGDASSGAANGKPEDAAVAGRPAAPAGPDETDAPRRRARAATAAAANVVRRSQRKPATAAAAQPTLETAASGGEGAARTETSTSSMIGSPVIVSSAIPLPVSVDERPLQVLFRGVEGAARVVSVDPVAFGSHEPAARPANATFTKATKKQGVW